MMYTSGVRIVLLHLELSVRPSTHLGRTGLDRMHVTLFLFACGCFMFALCLKLSVRPMDRTGLQFCHLNSQGVGPDLHNTMPQLLLKKLLQLVCVFLFSTQPTKACSNHGH